MPSARINALTREDITAAAKHFGGARSAKWTVIVEGRELPARPLVLEAAGVPPNDPTNSHQAVAILQDFGFEVRYEGKNITSPNEPPRSNIDELIQRLCGSLRVERHGPSPVEELQRDRRIEKDRWPK